jgi:hypothetical protein
MYLRLAAAAAEKAGPTVPLLEAVRPRIAEAVGERRSPSTAATPSRRLG